MERLYTSVGPFDSDIFDKFDYKKVENNNSPPTRIDLDYSSHLIGYPPELRKCRNNS
jgi:hypothetical protein